MAFPVVAGLVDALDAELRVPLTSMRAVVASRLRSGQHEDDGFLERALDELDELQATAELLLRASAPPRVQPLSCSLREIADAALALLPRSWRARVELDVLAAGQAWIDGPLFGLALADILRASMATDGDARLTLRISSDTLHARLLIAGVGEAQHALRLGCAWRELERMNAMTSVLRSREALEVSIEIPSAGCFEREVAA